MDPLLVLLYMSLSFMLGIIGGILISVVVDYVR